MKLFSDASPLFCDFERSDYCSLKLNSKICTENFQTVSASSIGDNNFYDVSLGNSKCIKEHRNVCYVERRQKLSLL